ncbi:MAG: hypothetical protein AAF555_11785 [Verrucomicrobiota bacterium]
MWLLLEQGGDHDLNGQLKKMIIAFNQLDDLQSGFPDVDSYKFSPKQYIEEIVIKAGDLEKDSREYRFFEKILFEIIYHTLQTNADLELKVHCDIVQYFMPENAVKKKEKIKLSEVIRVFASGL